MNVATPRIVVAGLSGDGGKTLLSVGLSRALTRRGLAVATFKKGPDYIDAAWLAAAAGRTARNLDTFLMDDAALGAALGRAGDDDLVVVEGNRGLFDGMDGRGSHSTAELAKKIGAPVLLVVDVRKVTRTAAALVAGCAGFDPELRIAAVVLNRVATARQERLVREVVEGTTGIPVIGAVPVLDRELLPGRHLGLMTAVEHPDREEALERAATAVEDHVSLEAVLAVARRAPERIVPDAPRPVRGVPVRVAVVQDEAFSFYYPENLEALTERGAEIVPVSALRDEPIPAVDAVYVGGGFPELYADRIASAGAFLESIRDAARRGVPTYAECGGLMLLGNTLSVFDRTYAMAGVLDVAVEQTGRPQGHGYVRGTVDRRNGFFREGTEIRGHEFHYSRVTGGADVAETTIALGKGGGIGAGRDGIAKGSVFASYLHVHAASSDAWADGLVAAARGG